MPTVCYGASRTTSLRKSRPIRRTKTPGKNTPDKAPIELNAALKRIVVPLLKDDNEFDKQFSDNPSFRGFVKEMVLQLIEK
jgi:type I restriction enzyme R subunit